MLLVLLQIFGSLDIFACIFTRFQRKDVALPKITQNLIYAKLVKLTNSSPFNFLHVGLINCCTCPNVYFVVQVAVWFIFSKLLKYIIYNFITLNLKCLVVDSREGPSKNVLKCVANSKQSLNQLLYPPIHPSIHPSTRLFCTIF